MYYQSKVWLDSISINGTGSVFAILSFFLPLRLNLRRGRQTGFGKRVQRGLAEIKEVQS